MSTIVIYKTKYGSTGTYARWIADRLCCEAVDAKNISIEELADYDTIIYGGGLYAEVINGVTLITKNLTRLNGKKIIVYTTGITPIDCRDYYDKLVIEKNFKPDMLDKIKMYNYLGKMVVNELSLVHRTAIKTLKKLMFSKENPTEMERLLVELCSADGDFTDKSAIDELVAYAQGSIKDMVK